MAFSFENAIDEISIKVNVTSKKDGEIEHEEVLHIFRAPTSAEIDGYRQRLTKFKGRKPTANFSNAALYLWNRTVLRVEGYEGIPENWKEFFKTNEVAQAHASSAAEAMYDVVSPDADLEKN